MLDMKKTERKNCTKVVMTHFNISGTVKPCRDNDCQLK